MNISRILKSLSVVLMISGTSLSVGLATAGASSTSSSSEAQLLKTVKYNPILHEELPAAIKKSKKLTVVGFPNEALWDVAANGSVTGEGVWDAEAIGKVLGVKIVLESTTGIPEFVTGVQDGRYDIGSGPVEDIASQDAAFYVIDSIEITQGYVYQGPKMTNLLGLCGKTVAEQAGSVPVEAALTTLSNECTAAGDAAITTITASGQPEELLDVQSGRAYAYDGTAPAAAYAVAHGTGLEDIDATPAELPPVLCGNLVAKTQPKLERAYFNAVRDLYTSGVYNKIMTAWGISGEEITKLAVNLNGSASS